LKGAATPRSLLSNGLVWLVTLAFIASPAMRLSAQTLTVTTSGDALHLQAPGFGFIHGEALDRLRSGRSLRFDFDLTALTRPGGAILRQIRQSFTLSYDLWEERFAVTRLGAPSRSVSHLTSMSAEAWCLDQLTLPVSALGRLGRDTPFWIRLEYRVVDRDRPPDADAGAGFTLRSLIELLSRRPTPDELRGTVDAGPFRLSD
jgi:hypothetical protein